ncbi:MAG: 4Fe-4S binding protein [Deltaproteobacteria bacterium]|nr:4Fe-4S binding protein [Deltaproteobacteria bacterium]
MKIPGVMAGEVLRHVAKAPATVNYPFVKVQMPPDFRGKMVFLAEKCIGCKLCAKDCPSNALAINKVGDKRFEAVFDLDKCIYCGQCIDSCNKDAIVSSEDFELAALSRDSLKFTFHAPPAPPPSAAPPAAAAPQAAVPAAQGATPAAQGAAPAAGAVAPATPGSGSKPS